MLYHVSEHADIARFEPRVTATRPDAVVWAIHEARLHNYLLPRECPRVTYCATPETTAADVERFLGASRAVIAVESRWAEQLFSTSLFCYQLPEHTFVCADAGAGYYVSHTAVAPRTMKSIPHPLLAIVQRAVEVRFLPSLRELGQAVVASSLQFSLIRMRNAVPSAA